MSDQILQEEYDEIEFGIDALSWAEVTEESSVINVLSSEVTEESSVINVLSAEVSEDESAPEEDEKRIDEKVEKELESPVCYEICQPPRYINSITPPGLKLISK